jgi:hypothetical protein
VNDYLVLMLQIPVETLVVEVMLGSALLAIWTLTRFERFGPRTLGSALLLSGAGLVLLTALGNVTQGVAAAGLPAGRFVIVLGVVVPVFTYFFLASAWLMRVVRDLFAGIG